MDFKNWGASRVAVFSDPTVSKLRPLKRAIESLEASGVPYDVYTDCRVEPNQEVRSGEQIDAKAAVVDQGDRLDQAHQAFALPLRRWI